MKKVKIVTNVNCTLHTDKQLHLYLVKKNFRSTCARNRLPRDFNVRGNLGTFMTKHKGNKKN